jgi:leader peptidase (prepilin peptidase)/N-methyltransferase
LFVGAVCGAAWFVVFYAMFFVSPKLIGFGDVRLAPVLGLSLGWLGWKYVILGFFAANLIGALIGIALIASHRMSRRQQIPYGVFLAMGCAVAVFAGPELLRPFTAS